MVADNNTVTVCIFRSENAGGKVTINFFLRHGLVVLDGLNEWAVNFLKGTVRVSCVDGSFIRAVAKAGTESESFSL